MQWTFAAGLPNSDMAPPDSTDAAPRAAYAYTLLTFTALFWAGNAVIGRALHTLIPPVALGFLRWAIALVIVLWLSRRAWRATWRGLRGHWRLVFALGASGVAAYNTLLYSALQTTTATNGLLINAVTPVFIVIAEGILFGVRLSLRQWAGLAAALAGIVVIVTRGSVTALATQAPLPGDLLLLLAAAAWTIYTLLLRRLPRDLDSIALLAATIGAGMLLLLPFYLWEHATGARPQWTAAALGGLAYIGVFPSVLAYLFYNKAVAAVGGHRAAMFLYLIPVFGLGLAIVFLHERLALFHAIGVAAIITGIVMATRQPARRAI